MVNTISQFRQDVVDVLNEAGIRAFDYAQPNAVPPYAVVVPADTYLMPGKTFGSFTVYLNVFLISPKGITTVQAKMIDEQLLEALAVVNDEFFVNGVLAPMPMEINGGVIAFGAIIEIEAEIKLERTDN